MAIITSIEQQVKDKTRVSVYVDGRFYCGMKLEIAVKYRLKAGLQIDSAYLDEIQLETEKSQALDRAFEHLSASMKTEKQMRDYLVKRGYVSAVVDYCIEKLRYYGYVNDEEYCKSFVASSSDKGRKKLEIDLKKRGVKDSDIEAALADFEEDGEQVYLVLTKYMRGKVCDRNTLYKAYRYIISKGYSYDLAKEAVDRFEDENNQS